MSNALLNMVVPMFLFFIYLFLTSKLILINYSIFPKFLPDVPNYWWPLLNFPCIIVLGMWAAINLFESDFFRNAVKISILLFLFCLITSLFSGVAIYSDKIVTRNLNYFSMETKTYMIKDLAWVDLSCDKNSKHVRRGFNRNLNSAADYNVFTKDGRKFDLTDGYISEKYAGSWLNSVYLFDRNVSQMSIPKRRVTDNAKLYGECLSVFKPKSDKEDKLKSIFIY
ncbi:hypothetical protein [Asticcacaulis excentricus]|uniref:hypothetical protein n=1 Tax=Asticcacaulis excentricus TaxID=78587 RepID=UPI000F83D975|nr:hypothetical protein [Asticcacaulis excentricus]